MKPSMAAAIDINKRWYDCLGIKDTSIPRCPDDVEIAVIIERHAPGAAELIDAINRLVMVVERCVADPKLPAELHALADQQLQFANAAIAKAEGAE